MKWRKRQSVDFSRQIVWLLKKAKHCNLTKKLRFSWWSDRNDRIVKTQSVDFSRQNTQITQIRTWWIQSKYCSLTKKYYDSFHWDFCKWQDIPNTVVFWCWKSRKDCCQCHASPLCTPVYCRKICMSGVMTLVSHSSKIMEAAD